VLDCVCVRTCTCMYVSVSVSVIEQESIFVCLDEWRDAGHLE